MHSGCRDGLSDAEVPRSLLLFSAFVLSFPSSSRRKRSGIRAMAMQSYIRDLRNYPSQLRSSKLDSSAISTKEYIPSTFWIGRLVSSVDRERPQSLHRFFIVCVFRNHILECFSDLVFLTFLKGLTVFPIL